MVSTRILMGFDSILDVGNAAPGERGIDKPVRQRSLISASVSPIRNQLLR